MIAYTLGVVLLVVAVTGNVEEFYNSKLVGQACTCSDVCLGNSVCQRDGNGGFACLCLPCQCYDSLRGECVNTPGYCQKCEEKCSSNLVCADYGEGRNTCKCPSTHYYDNRTDSCVNISSINEPCADTCLSNLKCIEGTCQCPLNQHWGEAQRECLPIPGKDESCQDTCLSNLECKERTCKCPPNHHWDQDQRCVPDVVCVNNQQNGCQGLVSGDYPACFPACQTGIYITCSNGYLYKRDCAIGWYIRPSGVRFIEKLVFDPTVQRCERKALYCPRPLDDMIEL